VPESQKMIIDYENLCMDPEREFGRYAEKIWALGYPLDRIGPPLKPIECANAVKVPHEESEKLRVALEEMRAPEV
jgi:hypothetical protein